MIFISSFMTHFHYLHSVLPHSEYLKSMLLNTLLSAGCGGMCLKSQCVGDWGKISQVQGQPGPSSTPCLRNKASHCKSQFCWVLPDGYSHEFSSFDSEVDGCFFFSVSLQVFSNPSWTSICHLGEGGLTWHWGESGCEDEIQFYCVGLEIDSILPGPAFSSHDYYITQ